MSKKRRLQRRIVTESEAWRVELLGDWGFSYKFIAKRVWGCDGLASVRAVGRVLKAAGMKVKDYRNGLNEIGESTAKRCMKQKGR